MKMVDPPWLKMVFFDYISFVYLTLNNILCPDSLIFRYVLIKRQVNQQTTARDCKAVSNIVVRKSCRSFSHILSQVFLSIYGEKQ